MLLYSLIIINKFYLLGLVMYIQICTQFLSGLQEERDLLVICR